MAKLLVVLALATLGSAGVVPGSVSRTFVNQHVTTPIKSFGLSPFTLHTFGGIGGIGGLGHIGHGQINQIASVSTLSHHHHHHPDHHFGLPAKTVVHQHHTSHLLPKTTILHHSSHILPTKTVVHHTSHAYAIPAGYYGGLMTYPQVISTSVATKALKIPHIAFDSYKGYYGGYYPGTVGQGTSYRFFH